MNRKYRIYIRKYNIIANDYVTYVKEVITHDIFHEIGLIYYKSLEKIDYVTFEEIKDER